MKGGRKDQEKEMNPFSDVSVLPEAELVHTAFRLLSHIREHYGTLVELHKGQRSGQI